MSELTQLNTMLAENQSTEIKLAGVPISQSEQDRQAIEGILKSIDSDHPAVPILKALLTGENLYQMVNSILSDSTGITPELTQFLAKYFHDSLLLSLKNGAEFDAGLERAVDMTQSVANTWTAANIAAANVIDQTDTISGDNFPESSSVAEEESAIDSKDLQEALQKLYSTDTLEIGTEPETEPEIVPESLVVTDLEAEATLNAEKPDEYLKEILNTLIPALEPDSVQEDEYEASVPESFIVEAAPESLSLESFDDTDDGGVGLESSLAVDSDGTTDMGYDAPDTVITPTHASYAPSMNPQTLYYEFDSEQSNDTIGLRDDGVATQASNPTYSSDSPDPSPPPPPPPPPPPYISYDPEFSGDKYHADITLIKNTTQGVVSIFAYPNLNGDDKVDESVDNETKNVVSIVKEKIKDYTLNTDITNFHNNFKTNLNDSDVFFMTDLAGSEIGSAQDGAEIDYPDTSKEALKNWVNDGGTFIITGSDNGPRNNLYTAVDFLNDTFNWDMEFVDVNPKHEDAVWHFNDAASGTTFDYEGAPSQISFEHTTTTIGAGNVSSFIPIYGDEDDAAVAVISYGSGEVIFIGYDYNNAGFKDTGIEGVNYNNDVETGVNSDTAWVQEIIPSAFSYAQLQSYSGTLSLEDQNQEDTVSVSVTSVTCEGKVGNFDSTNDKQLMDWFKLSGGLDAEATDGKVHWTFIAGDSTDDFNHLNSGGDMTITYTIQAKDDSPDAATDEYTITVTLSGSNGTNSIVVDNSDSKQNLITTTESSPLLAADGEENFEPNADTNADIDYDASGTFIQESLQAIIHAISQQTTNDSVDTGYIYENNLQISNVDLIADPVFSVEQPFASEHITTDTVDSHDIVHADDCGMAAV